jgi:hypothetical protein
VDAGRWILSRITIPLLLQFPNPQDRRLSEHLQPLSIFTMDANALTTPYQLTKSMHRDVYPAVDPMNPALKVEGKVVLITGAGGGIGYVRSQTFTLHNQYH